MLAALLLAVLTVAVTALVYGHGRRSPAVNRTAAPFASVKVPADTLVAIPAGPFLMGSDSPLANPDERPPHQAATGAYLISRYLTTNASYARYVAATHAAPPPNWRSGVYPAGRAAHPVLFVSFYDAAAYARWAGGRLCSEAEWEKAARGTDGRVYPWGNQFDQNLANSELPLRDTTPAGAYPRGAGPYGVLDMAGDAWQWTADRYQPYPGNSVDDPLYHDFRVTLRGGSWRSSPFDLRTTARLGDPPDLKADFAGFRICADQPLPGWRVFTP